MSDEQSDQSQAQAAAPSMPTASVEPASLLGTPPPADLLVSDPGILTDSVRGSASYEGTFYAVPSPSQDR